MSLRVSVVFTRVVSKPEYQPLEKRLLDSYYKYKTDVPHELVIIDRYGDSPDDVEGAKHLRYDQQGWDCGAWQFAGKNIDTDLLVCFNSSTYITCHLWLKRFVEAVEAHGEGLYGPLTSNEVNPHVRTPCMIFQPKIINSYPKEVASRLDTYRFESMGWPDGTPNFTQWASSQGYATMLVSLYGAFDQKEWREPAHIFRRGDQHCCLVKDRHCDAYDASDEAGKRKLEELAGLQDPVHQAYLDRAIFNIREEVPQQ